MKQRDKTEIERRLAGLVVIGTVSQVDHKLGRYRVQVGENESDWIASSVSRSGGTRTFESRDVGEQVVVVSPSGDLSQGVIVGAIATEERQAGEKASEHRTIYPDGTTVDYDDESHSYSITVPEGGGAVSVSSGGSVNVEGAKAVGIKSAQTVNVDGAEGTIIRGAGATLTFADGRMTMEGRVRLVSADPIEFVCPELRHNGVSIGHKHKHTGVEPGSGTSGPPEG